MSKLSKYVIAIAVTAVILFLVWYFSNIVTYLLISAVLAIIGKPLVELLTRLKIRDRHLPKWLAALLTLLCIWAVAVVFFSLFIPLVLGKLSEFSRLEIPLLIDSLRVPLSQAEVWLQNFFATYAENFSLTDAITQQITQLLNINALNNFFSSIFSVIGSTVVALFSISFITFFFLKEDRLFYNMVVAVFPNRYEENIRRALDSVTVLLVRYFTGILTESTIIMLLISGVLMIWGFTAENAFFIGLVIGILNVIPYIGPLIGAGISIFVGIASPLPGMSVLDMTLIIGGTVVCIKALDDFILQPVLYSNRVKAHPLEIFIVILIAGSVAGVLGMLLAIPSYTVLRVFAKEFFYNFKLVQKLTEKI